jgi:hypothetical protein
MGWRGRYYYRSVRQGRRVLTEYRGAGDVAEMAAALDAEERAERQAEREARKAELALDMEIDAAGRQLRGALEAALLASGYHKHKGTWRRRRHGHRG